jgi:hypothetical protein
MVLLKFNPLCAKQDTLRSPPSEIETMNKASRASIAITTFFYLGCGCFGYAAFGDATPGNLLTGFYEPYWLIDLANLCVVLHLLGGFQARKHTPNRGTATHLKLPQSRPDILLRRQVTACIYVFRCTASRHSCS